MTLVVYSNSVIQDRYRGRCIAGISSVADSTVYSRAVRGIAGINSFVVLIIGIISGTVIMLATGNTAPYDLLTNMGSGASGMFETCMVGSCLWQPCVR